MKRPAGLERKVLIVLVIAVPIGWFLLNFGANIYEVETPITASPFDCAGPAGGATRFAVIGDFGTTDKTEADVAALVNSWAVDFIVTVGDNNYPHGEALTIDENIGQYYQAYIHRFLWPVPESLVRYNRDYGAQLLTADDVCINSSMVSRKGELVDSLTLAK